MSKAEWREKGRERGERERRERERMDVRKRVQRDSGIYCVSRVNSSINAPNRNYFFQNTSFSILELFGPRFLIFFPFTDLKHNLPQMNCEYQ